MERAELRRRLVEILGLKALPRAGWVRAGVAAPESVAAHSWGVAWLVLALAPPSIDRGRALAIAVIHDLAEVRVGDLTPHDRVTRADKVALEEAALVGLLAGLDRAAELAALWLDYESGASAEARFVKACDRLDMALQAQAYAASDGIDPREFIASALAGLGDPELRALIDDDLS
ncbi:MAG: HD domain-containing protein [Myxococcales bacterium]|nr:HD domain-containing protein [Myxococcales bacterium]MCB9702436.1 HD domain-containing protein [Myxococcales bacterium]